MPPRNSHWKEHIRKILSSCLRFGMKHESGEQWAKRLNKRQKGQGQHDSVQPLRVITTSSFRTWAKYRSIIPDCLANHITQRSWGVPAISHCQILYMPFSLIWNAACPLSWRYLSHCLRFYPNAHHSWQFSWSFLHSPQTEVISQSLPKLTKTFYGSPAELNILKSCISN